MFNDAAALLGLGCPAGGCVDGTRALMLELSSGLKWRASIKTELEPYICVSKCKRGYKWLENINRCLRVEGDGIRESEDK